MRPRHTFRTDGRMEGDRKQISVRLSGFYRQRIKEVTGDDGLPDIHSESDLIQDSGLAVVSRIRPCRGEGGDPRWKGSQKHSR